MAWSTEISQLVTETQQFIDAVELNKPTLDAAANTAILNAASASVSAANTVVIATASTTSADVSKGHAVATEAIANLTKLQQDAVSDAERQSSLAAGYALSAGSIVQQDLSGVTAAALHRSPNAVTSMFVYDTSKDSDGGAWTEKCQGTSWYNEDLSGKWLGQQVSELEARASGATLGPETVINGTFTDNSSTGWSLPTGATVSDGKLNLNVPATNVVSTYAVELNKTYQWEYTVSNYVSGIVNFYVGGGTRHSANANGTYRGIIVGPSVVTTRFLSTGSPVASVDNISVREVTALTTTSNDYFQLTTDGKFYRLWKNVFSRSEEFDNAIWQKSNCSVPSTQFLAPDGTTTAESLIPDTVAASHFIFAGQLFSPYTLSVYAKANIGTLNLWLGDNSAGARTYFNLATGSVASGSGFIEPVGNGWYRCSIVNITGTISVNHARIGVSVGTNQTAASNGTDSILIWGAQLEYGPSMTTYEPKTAFGSTSEVFRGNKRDFPRLAGIVAETSTLTIYDLTEPGRPMWMRFVGGNNQLALGWANNTTALTSVATLNGSLVVGSTQGNNIAVNFTTDDIRLIYGGNSSYELKSRKISDRHNTGSYVFAGSFVPQIYDSYRIASNVINAIAMTVLPDAPTDPVTGMKVPTIAVGNGGGVSVIKHNGTVVNSAITNSITSINITTNILTFSIAAGRHFGYVLQPGNVSTAFAVGLPSDGPPDFYRGTNLKVINSSRTSIARLTGSTLIQTLKNNEAVPARGISTTLTNTFNTGWMPGDIRRTYLSDTDVRSVSGVELITNGNFDTNIDGWFSSRSGVLSYDNGTIRIASGGIVYGKANQTISTVVGKLYELRFTLITGTTVGAFVVSASLDGFEVLNRQGLASGTYRFSFQATSTTTYIGFQNDPATVGVYFNIDNVSVKEAILDRSYKAQAAPVNGTITRSQLASGTSLVGYSGWSTANYLQEPYSADLDFGTGEFSTSAWFNTSISRRNLLTYSEDFSNVTWSKTNVTASPHNVADPDGGFTASTITATTASGYFFYNSASNPTSGSTTVSLWIRRRTGTGDIRLRTAAVGVDTIIDVTSSWQRISVVCVAIAATSNCWVLNIVTSGDAVDIWHPQLELGSVATSYQKVITASDVISPIFDRAHSFGPRVRLAMNGLGNLAAEASDGTTTRTATTTATYNIAQWVKAETTYTTDGSLGIRVNGREVAVTRGNPLLTLNSRRNLLTWTEQFDNALWLRPAGTTTISPNTATAPDGTMTADLVTATAGNNCHYVYQANLGTASVTFSVYAKAGTASWIGIGSGYTNGGETAWFNLATGTPGTVSSGGTSTMVDALNGWWRCSITRPTWVAGGALVFITNADAAPTFNAVGTETVLLWGAQGEIGTAPTTYQRITATPETNVAPLTIGNSFAFDAPFSGSIALLKLGATVPTTEQSTFMYEQEKQLFRADAVAVLPDATSILDMSYDDATDRWSAVSATNESYWTGLVRNSVTPVPAGSYSKITTTSGIELTSRTTTNPGVDVSIPTYLLREDLNRRAEAASKVFKEIVNFDYVGGFTTSTTTGSTAITSVANLTYPVSPVGARISGAGIPTNATIVAVVGTTIYISAAATATATGVSISFLDFELPTGFEAETVATAGAIRREGTTADFTRLFDGFFETVRFAVAPGSTTWVQIQASRTIS